MCKRQNALGRSIPIILVWSSWLRFYRGIAVLLYNGGLSRQEKHDMCKRCVRYVRACAPAAGTYAACEYVRFRCTLPLFVQRESGWVQKQRARTGAQPGGNDPVKGGGEGGVVAI